MLLAGTWFGVAPPVVLGGLLGGLLVVAGVAIAVRRRA
jgi:hypothetical protein